MLTTAEAILLDVRDLQEQDRIVTFLTRDRGKLSGAARAARRKHSRFAGQLQPLAKARVTWFEKEGRELVRVSGVDLVRPAAKLQEDLEGILLGSYLAEHALVFAQENEPSELLYRLLDSILEALLAGLDRELAARYFESWMLRLAGVFPAPAEGCPLCGEPFGETAVLPASAEALLCRRCAGSAGNVREASGDDNGAAVEPHPAEIAGARAGERISIVGPDVLDFLTRIGRESPAAMAARPPSPETLRRAEELAARVRRGFLQRELNSYRVMERTLSETRPEKESSGG